MDLFQPATDRELERGAPLAARLRPRSLDEFVGQKHLVGPGTLLRRAIEADRVGSLILYGPTGSGKTTLVRIIAQRTAAHFEQLNAVTAGVADLRRVVREARDRRAGGPGGPTSRGSPGSGRRTLLFVDEIHRFNKAQQDALLPAVEDGVVDFVGATTENPFHTVVGPLLSRCRIFRFEPLSDADIRCLLDRALADRERGLGAFRVEVEPAALDLLVARASGDARAALNGLEAAVLNTPPGPDGVRRVSSATAADAVQQKLLTYDRDGDAHYDVMSAFIKSMRGSDPDAAVYWLARMLAGGEDPRAIARRIVIHAAEDVGNADPQALVVAVAAAQAVEFVGLPEARIPLAQAAIYIACAPKSNATVTAIARAAQAVEERAAAPVPPHLRDASYRGAARLGHGRGYQYPHDHPEGWVAQQYLPAGLEGSRFYEPTDRGYEAEIRRRLARRGGPGERPAHPPRVGPARSPDPGPARGAGGCA